MDKHWIVVWTDRDKLVGAVQYDTDPDTLEKRIRDELDEGLWLKLTDVRTVLEFHQVVQGTLNRMVLMVPPDFLSTPASSVLIKPTAVRVPVGKEYQELLKAIEQSEKAETVQRAQAAGIQLTLPGTGLGGH